MSNYAIPTEYNGYKFRSRLEARWAVFFDAVGIKYQYELEGYETSKGIGRYLPDFYLPEYKTHVEVKGDEEQYRKDLPRMIKCLEGDDAPIKRLLILGNIPYSKEANGVYWYPVLYYHPLSMRVLREYKAIVDNVDNDGKSNVYFTIDWYTPDEEPDYRWHILWDGNAEHERLDPVPDELLEPRGILVDYCNEYLDPFRVSRTSPALVAAYRKAKQARFEYGETPSATDA